MKEDLSATDAAVVRFHRQLDAGRPEDIFGAAAPEMKAAASASMLVPILSAVHRKLGRVTASARRSFNDQRTTAGHFVALTYAARFERGDGTESFTFKIDDGRATLAGYNVSSPALILN